MKILLEEFKAFVKSLEGKMLKTRFKECLFSVAVHNGFLKYVPDSTGIPRKHSNKFIERVLERHAEINSLRPKDYSDISKNSSYMMTLIECYVQRNTGA